MSLDFDHTKLLAEFKKVPVLQPPEPTFLEIAGYPDFENVCSNILQFYLDPGNEHGLGTLLLESLLTSAGHNLRSKNLQNVEVDREAVTDSRYRIDLVIQTEDMIIGVENKLFAKVNNDFNDYHVHLVEHADGRLVVAILLSLFQVQDTKELHGFIPIMYEKYFEDLLSKAGRSLLGANNKHITFLFDFINTIERLKKGNTMSNPEFVQWLKEKDHEQDTQRLYKELNSFRKELKEKAKILGSMIDLGKYLDSGVKIDQWIWDGFQYEQRLGVSLVYDFPFDSNFPLAIDTTFSASGCGIYIQNRKKEMKDSKRLFDWLDAHNISYKPNENGKALFGVSFQLNDDPRIIQSRLQELLDGVVSAIQNG